MASSHIRILSIGLEKALFRPGPVRDRIVAQAEAAGAEMTTIVFGRVPFDEQIAPHLRVISTDSLHPVFYVSDALRVFWRLRKEKFDLVMSQDPAETGIVAYVASRLFRIPFAIQDHSHMFHGDVFRRESFLNLLRRMIAPFLLDRADAIRVVSKRTEDAMIRLGVPLAKIVRFPVSMTFRLDSVKKISDENGVKFFLLPSRFVAYKRIDVAIKAFACVLAKRPEVKLVIIGRGPLEKQIRQWIAESGVADRIEVRAWVDNLSDLYRSATATLLVSDQEGFGMTAVESLTHGTPVVMTDVGCAGEVVHDGKEGYIVPPGDMEALADRMLRILDDPDGIRKRLASFRWNPPVVGMRDLWELASASSRRRAVPLVIPAKAGIQKEKQKEISIKLAGEKRRSPSDILFVTQVVDKYHPTLPHIAQQIHDLADQNEKLTVFARVLHREDLPKGVQGEELGKPYLRGILKLWWFSFKHRKFYDAVIVHNMREARIFGWMIWRLLGKDC